MNQYSNKISLMRIKTKEIIRKILKVQDLLVVKEIRAYKVDLL